MQNFRQFSKQLLEKMYRKFRANFTTHSKY